ncbi:MAG: hypothetical protein DHS20C20_17890 [Ardenticatenaceae bacterium]|nr:MAG: hypothetical protein DHS20C20_17890 [Ardenticatenaceae bacterium]
MNGDPKQFAREIFSVAKTSIPSGREIAKIAIDEIFKAYGDDLEKIKANASTIVASVQSRAYEIYLSYEASASAAALKQAISAQLPPGATSNDLFEYMAENFAIFDKFFLSLTQSRKPRAGSAFEDVVSALLQSLGYPFTPQPELAESRPDYVLPSIEYYNSYAADCIIFTCKRTLRERWRQVVTEGGTGQSFFLGTIDEKLTSDELSKMKDRRVIVVVPKEVEETKYAKYANVISFERFFLHHLDPAMARWKAGGIVS